MTPENSAGALDEQLRVVNCVHAAARIQFIAADHHVGVGFCGGFTKAGRIFAGN